MDGCILIVKFDRAEVQAAIAAMGLEYPADVELTVIGTIGTFPFTGTDTIRVIFPSGDINSDGIVDLGDFVLLKNSFGSKPGKPNWNPACDLDESGAVDLADFGILRNNFGTTL